MGDPGESSRSGDVLLGVRPGGGRTFVVVDRDGPHLRSGAGELVGGPLGLDQLLWAAHLADHPKTTEVGLVPPDGAATIAAAVGSTGVRRSGASDGARRAEAGDGAGLEGPFRLVVPFVVELTTAGFELCDHDGEVQVVLSAVELASVLGLIEPRVRNDAILDLRIRLEDRGVTPERFPALVAVLVGAGRIVAGHGGPLDVAEERQVREFRRGFEQERLRAEAVARTLEEGRRAEAEREAATGRRRTKVVPVNSEGNPLLSLGLLMTYAQSVDDGRLNEHYEFLPDWANRTIPSLTGDEPPGIYLFSNYIWSSAWNVERSAEVKARSPHSITVHGGPNTPKYEADAEAYFQMNPQVDIAVHGEGEATFVELLDALVGQLDDGPLDTAVLHDIQGIAFRDGDRIVRTESRERIADLDLIPSPYTSGLFDSVGDTEITLMTLETNRGCPYGCTFCDWGSATLSRIRKFDLDRVFAELEWIAQHKVKVLFCADANFGIFERDVEIARKIVELRETYGYPKLFESSYAKNTVKHLRQIIDTLVTGGVLSTGSLALQSVDQGTLDAIHRSNIKVEKYDDLASEFGRQGLPLVVELMMGLPGSTLESFRADLQQCIDRDVKARVNPTEVLMNSTMNEPGYRDEHRIETLRPVNQDWSEANQTRKKALIVSTATFTRDDYEGMQRSRLAFLFFENFGVLRQVSRFVRQETGIPEIEFYRRLTDAARAEPARWPSVNFVFETIDQVMVPPSSWLFFIEEVGRFVTEVLAVADDSALQTVLLVQHSLIPATGRRFPLRLELDHDYGAWHSEVMLAKRSGDETAWTHAVPHLSSYGPAAFEVEDPQSISLVGLGMGVTYDADGDWELQSPVSRPMRFRHTVHV